MSLRRLMSEWAHPQQSPSTKCFHHLPANSFPGTGQVVSLHLQLCKIHRIGGGAFQGMKNLVYLYLSVNDLKVLDPRAFAGVPELTYLHLDGNQLSQFPGSDQQSVRSHCYRNNVGSVFFFFNLVFSVSFSSGTTAKSLCAAPGKKQHL